LAWPCVPETLIAPPEVSIERRVSTGTRISY